MHITASIVVSTPRLDVKTGDSFVWLSLSDDEPLNNVPIFVNGVSADVLAAAAEAFNAVIEQSAAIKQAAE